MKKQKQKPATISSEVIAHKLAIQIEQLDNELKALKARRKNLIAALKVIEKVKI